MFNTVKYMLRSKWEGDYVEVSGVLKDYFRERKESVVSESDDILTIKVPGLPDVECFEDMGIIHINFTDMFKFSNICLVHKFLDLICDIIEDANCLASIKGIYADYVFESINYDQAVQTIRLSLQWWQYNHALSGIYGDDNTPYRPLPYELIDELPNNARSGGNADELKMLWLMHAQKPVVDLSPYIFSNEPIIEVYLGTDIDMVDTLLWYYYHFFDRAFAHIARPNENREFKVNIYAFTAFLACFDGDVNNKRFRRNVVAKLRSTFYK